MFLSNGPRGMAALAHQPHAHAHAQGGPHAPHHAHPHHGHQHWGGGGGGSPLAEHGGLAGLAGLELSDEELSAMAMMPAHTTLPSCAYAARLMAGGMGAGGMPSAMGGGMGGGMGGAMSQTGSPGPPGPPGASSSHPHHMQPTTSQQMHFLNLPGESPATPRPPQP